MERVSRSYLRLRGFNLTLPASFLMESELIREDLRRLHQYDNYPQLSALASYNAKRGDVFNFHEGNSVGRLAEAQESGMFCNLDGN